MNKFWELVESSAIVQALLALLVIGADVYLFMQGKPVPAELWALTTLIVGFYFGAKSQAQLGVILRTMKKM